MAIVARKSEISNFAHLPLLDPEQRSLSITLIEDRPIMSVVEEAPDTAYVKGGLFAKHGTELPPVGYEVYFKRSEPWETAAKGAHVVEG